MPEGAERAGWFSASAPGQGLAVTSVAVAPLVWRVATIAGIRGESDSARSLLLEVPGWPGHLAGQHIDARLIAEDGYAAQRSYSIASDPSSVEITVQRVAQREVSSYLCDIAEVGDQFELRGPVGGYVTWHPGRSEPVLPLAGGSGIVPLMAMIRTRARPGPRYHVRLHPPHPRRQSRGRAVADQG